MPLVKGTLVYYSGDIATQNVGSAFTLSGSNLQFLYTINGTSTIVPASDCIIRLGSESISGHTFTRAEMGSITVSVRYLTAKCDYYIFVKGLSRIEVEYENQFYIYEGNYLPSDYIDSVKAVYNNGTKETLSSGYVVSNNYFGYGHYLSPSDIGSHSFSISYTNQYGDSISNEFPFTVSNDYVHSITINNPKTSFLKYEQFTCGDNCTLTATYTRSSRTITQASDEWTNVYFTAGGSMMVSDNATIHVSFGGATTSYTIHLTKPISLTLGTLSEVTTRTTITSSFVSVSLTTETNGTQSTSVLESGYTLFYLDSSDSQYHEIVFGTTVLPITTTHIKARYVFNNVETLESSASSISVKGKMVSSVSFSPDAATRTYPILSLGYKWDSQKYIYQLGERMIVTWEDGTTDHGYDLNLVVVQPSGTGEFALSATTLSFKILQEDGTYYTKTLTNNASQIQIAWNIPTIKSIDFSESHFDEMQVNGYDNADLSGIVATARYISGNELVGYRHILYFSDLTITSGLDTLVDGYDQTDPATKQKYDGTKIVKAESDMTGVTEKNYDVTYSWTSPFDSGTTCSTSTSGVVSNGKPKFRVVIMNSVDYVRVSRAYFTYKVGNRFLIDEPDDEATLVEVGYNTNKNFIIPLKSNPSFLTVSTKYGEVLDEIKSEMTITVRSKTKSNEIFDTYNISVLDNLVEYAVKEHTIRAHKISSDITVGDFGLILEANDYILVSEEDRNALKNGTKILGSSIEKQYLGLDGEYGYMCNGVEVFGYLDSIFDTSNNAKVVLFKNYLPPVESEANAEVLFTTYNAENPSKINKCRIGHLFGNSNAKNRLFVSGNQDLPNCDWHSGSANDENGNFTYFEDDSYCFYGQTDNAIVGYDIVSTDKMIVFKSKSDKEPTYYYRSSSLNLALDASGNTLYNVDGSNLYQEVYPLSTGDRGVTPINHFGITNFNGDTLFISYDGEVDGLSLDGIQGDTKRTCYTRSYRIDPKLREKTKTQLDKAVIWNDGKYLFVSLEDETYITYFDQFDSDESQYEWWKMDIGNASCFLSTEKGTMFGTYDGNFFLLNDTEYKDTTFVERQVSISITADFDDKVTMNSTFSKTLNNGYEHFVSFPTALVISDRTKQFKLVSEDGGEPTASQYNSGEFLLGYGFDPLTKKYTTIKPSQLGFATGISILANVLEKRPVKAFYITAPNVLGDLMHSKTIWGWSMTNDTNLGGEVEVCQATNDIDIEQMSSMAKLDKQDYGLSVNAFNMGSLSFSKCITPYKYTYWRPLALVPFICFGFRNMNASNSVLCALQVNYTVSTASFGER